MTSGAQAPEPVAGALLTLLLILDWFLVLAYQPSVPARVTVPYSYFLGQIDRTNVTIVTAQGSTIDGTVRHWITYNGTRAGHALLQDYATGVRQ